MVFLVNRGKSLFCMAAMMAKRNGRISIAEVQREFAPGLRAATDVVELLVLAGIVGPYGNDDSRPYLGGVM